jgi:hypothetical protein
MPILYPPPKIRLLSIQGKGLRYPAEEQRIVNFILIVNLKLLDGHTAHW